MGDERGEEKSTWGGGRVGLSVQRGPARYFQCPEEPGTVNKGIPGIQFLGHLLPYL